MTRTDVERLLGWPPRTLDRYERSSLGRVPCDHFYLLIRLYKVSFKEALRAVDRLRVLH